MNAQLLILVTPKRQLVEIITVTISAIVKLVLQLTVISKISALILTNAQLIARYARKVRSAGIPSEATSADVLWLI